VKTILWKRCLVVFSTWRLARLKFHQIDDSLAWGIYSTWCFVNMALWWLDILSTVHFVDRPSCQLDLWPTGPLANWTFCQPTRHFVNSATCLFNILSTWHFVNFIFCQLGVLSTCAPFCLKFHVLCFIQPQWGANQGDKMTASLDS
jgi:hypothetical protein